MYTSESLYKVVDVGLLISDLSPGKEWPWGVALQNAGLAQGQFSNEHSMKCKYHSPKAQPQAQTDLMPFIESKMEALVILWGNAGSNHSKGKDSLPKALEVHQLCGRIATHPLSGWLLPPSWNRGGTQLHTLIFTAACSAAIVLSQSWLYYRKDLHYIKRWPFRGIWVFCLITHFGLQSLYIHWKFPVTATLHSWWQTAFLFSWGPSERVPSGLFFIYELN